MKWLLFALLPLLFASGCEPSAKTLIAHRGSSAYAPEHTLEAYRLALQQGADFVEQDLQITRDGELVCLHDETLERTTNVEEVFPNRFREVAGERGAVRQWFVSDFSLQEIKALDAGSWFSKKFAGSRVLVFAEAIELIRGKAGIFPELKSPDRAGVDMGQLVMDELRRAGLDRPGADPATPVILQSFSAATLRHLRGDLGCALPLILLVGNGEVSQLLSREGLRRIRDFATGIGPDKRILLDRPEIVSWAHDEGLTVTPYTFSSKMPNTRFPNVRDEMSFYLVQLGVDALFTDNPDQFPDRGD